MEALLEVAAYPDFSICAMSFNFWHRCVVPPRTLRYLGAAAVAVRAPSGVLASCTASLPPRGTQRTHALAPDIHNHRRLSRHLVASSNAAVTSAEDAAERERRRQFFLPAFERLVQLIRGRVRWVGDGGVARAGRWNLELVQGSGCGAAEGRSDARMLKSPVQGHGLVGLWGQQGKNVWGLHGLVLGCVAVAWLHLYLAAPASMGLTQG